MANESVNALEGVIASRQIDGNIQLRWKIPEGSPPIAFRIYRSKVRGFEPNAEDYIVELLESSTIYIDEDVVQGIKYYYKVAAVYAMDNSVFSGEVVATEEARLGPNLVINGSFENYTGSAPNDWTGATPAMVANDYSIDGDRSLRIISDGSRDLFRQQVVTKTPNANYVLSYWVKGKDISPTESKSRGARVLCNHVFTPENRGTFDWTEIKVTFTVDDSATNISLRPYMYFMSGTAWFDDIRLHIVDGTPPEVPTELEVTPVIGTKNINLTWTESVKAPDEDFADKYRVYRGNSSEELIMLGEISASKTTYFDQDIPDDVELFYYITALDKLGNESDLSECAILKRASARGRVVDQNGEPLSGVELHLEGTSFSQWSSSDGSFEFNLIPIDNYKIIARLQKYQIGTRSFSLQTGEDFDLGDIELELDDIKPNEPQELSADGSSHVGVVFLTWEEPKPARDLETASFYNIYRSTLSDVKREGYNYVGTTTETSFTYKAEEAEFEKTLYFIVESVDNAENISQYGSNIASATVLEPPVPIPTSPSNREIFVDEPPSFNWIFVENNELKGFRIQVCEDPNFDEEKIFSHDCMDSTSTTYMWTNEFNQSTWFWRIKGLYNKEVESVWSPVNEFVTSSLFENPNVVPYLNVFPPLLEKDSIEIGYMLTKESQIEIRIFNAGGKLVKILVPSQNKPPGYHEINWKGEDAGGNELPNGLYIIQLIVKPTEGKYEKMLKKLDIYR